MAAAKVEVMMRHISLLVLLTVFMPFAAAQSARDGKTLVITQVTVIDVATRRT